MMVPASITIESILLRTICLIRHAANKYRVAMLMVTVYTSHRHIYLQAIQRGASYIYIIGHKYYIYIYIYIINMIYEILTCFALIGAR